MTQWTLHKQPADLVASHRYSIFEDDERIVVLLDPLPGHEDKLALIAAAPAMYEALEYLVSCSHDNLTTGFDMALKAIALVCASSAEQ